MKGTPREELRCGVAPLRPPWGLRRAPRRPGGPGEGVQGRPLARRGLTLSGLLLVLASRSARD
jgi:hypothetical protein